MKITLIRHASTEQNFLEINQGRQNNPLNDEGRRKALKLKEKIKDNRYDYCYMSPLVRAVETAIILIGDRVVTVIDDRINERGLGEFEGMPRKFYDPYKYWDYTKNCCERGVEPIQDVFKRCSDFLEYLKTEHEDESIMVISHSSIIRVLRHLILKTDLTTDLLDVDIDNLYYEEFEI